MTRSDELQKNFYNEKALEIYQLLPCNRTKLKDKQPFIKHGLVSVLNVNKKEKLERAHHNRAGPFKSNLLEDYSSIRTVHTQNK